MHTGPTQCCGSVILLGSLGLDDHDPQKAAGKVILAARFDVDSNFIYPVGDFAARRLNASILTQTFSIW
jgi:hypothetical protein